MQKTYLFILLASLCFLSFETQATVIFVDYSSSGTNTGASWTNAYTSLQSAVTNAVSGDEVWVAAGTYIPSAYPVGRTSTDIREYSFYLESGVEYYGGFAGTETLRSQRDYANNATVLSGNITGNNCYHVLVSANESSVVLDGFTVTAGYANGGTNATINGQSGFWTNNGGGVFTINTTMTVENCIISNNTAGYGGAIRGVGGTTTLTNCTLTGNTGTAHAGAIDMVGTLVVSGCTFTSNKTATSSNGNGGAIKISGGVATISNTSFISNVGRIGGAIHHYSSQLTISTSTFSNNSATNHGGALYASHTAFTVTKCVFDGNTATNNGGGISTGWGATMTLNNSVFSENTSGSSGGAISNDMINGSAINCTFYANTAAVRGGAYSSVSNSINGKNCVFFGNKKGTSTNVSGADTYGGSFTYSLTQSNSNFSSGTGIVNNQDPLFINASDPDGADNVWMTADDGLSFFSNSPAYGVGTSSGAPSTDITGASRASSPSMGAYEGFSYTRYLVDIDATGTGAGTSWTNAYTGLQDAIDASSVGDEIWVAEGTYIPNVIPQFQVTSTDNRHKTFAINKNIAIYGGFDGTESVLSQRDAKLNITVLSGDLGTIGTVSDNCFHVVMTANLNSTAIIDGFTIQDGNANGGNTTDQYGGRNFARELGGGIASNFSSPTLSNLIIKNNRAKIGAGVSNSVSSSYLINLTFVDNIANEKGGGVANITTGSPSIINCVFSGNLADDFGGGIYSENSPTITNCTFFNNKATTTSQGGGGVYAINAGTTTVSNCIFFGNKIGSSTTNVGSDIKNGTGHTTTVDYSMVQLASGSYTSGNTNALTSATSMVYNQDPLFSGHGGPDGVDNVWMTEDDGLRLNSNSPAVDAGLSSAISGYSTDIVGTARVVNTNVNMGAYEVLCSETTKTITANVCDSYTSPSGKTWITSNTYSDTIANTAGCDSVITVNLTVRDKTTETITANVCDSYTSPSGKTWTTSNTYSDTIANDAGCDSVITVNLTVRYKSSFSFAETVYETFTSPSGKTWTNSGTYLDTIPNDVNCDSIITVDLTVINKLFVDTDGSSGTGKSWGNPMKTLDDAINAANKTDNHAEIWMRKGMYYPGGKSSSNRDSAFVVTNPNVELLGGFSGTETEPGQRNQTANPTILCGDIGKANDSSDNAYHVLIIAPNGSDIGPNFKLDGLTFKNGNADGNSKYTYENRDVYQSEGGSIVILGSGKSGQEISPTITNCHFEGNYGDYGSIYIRVPNGKSFATISHCTFKNNHSIYGAIFNDGQAGEVSPNIVNCAFDGNTSATSGAAIYNYGYGGKCSPTITSCVFNSNSASSMGGAIYNTGYGGTSNPVITNATFHANAAGSHAGAMYSFGNSGTCQPKVTNSIFYKNTKGGDVDHKFSEFYNYAAYPYIKNSSMQRASSTYTASTFNSLNSGTNNIFQTNPNFEAIADGNGADDVWRTGDDGLRLSSSSTNLLNGGTNTGAPTADILGNQRMGTTDMGAYEYVNCGLNVKLATSVTTHTATQSVVDGNFVCYCNSDNELLLALDTNGTGAVITPSQVKLYIGNPSTLSYNSAGGMITNTAGGVILERRWDVEPTTQPTSPVTVRYFYTNDNYDDIVTAMAGLTSPTTITSPSQLQFYKVTGGSSATFPNPHDTGVTGIVLTNGTTASTTVWVNGTHGVQDHTAEYLVSTFSGGGGGGGGGSSPLPVELIQFEASPAASHTADLTWKTASELNNSHFVVERSYDGRDFQAAAIVQGNGTTQNVITYNHNDNTIDLAQNTVFYRLRQVDFDGTKAYSPVRRVDFEGSIIPNSVTLYPNPTKGTVTVSFTDDEAESHAIKVIDNLGRELYKQTFDGQAIELDLSSQATGIYFIILDSGESFKVIKQ